MMIIRLTEAPRHENSQQDVLGLVTEDKVLNEQATFTEMEETYEGIIDKANAIISGYPRAEEGTDLRPERAVLIAAWRRNLHEQIMEILNHVVFFSLNSQ